MNERNTTAATVSADRAQKGEERARKICRLLAIGCQALSISFTWPLWNLRQSPPNLPWFTPIELSMGWLMVATTCICLVAPRAGAWLHAVVLAIAITLDQFRLQPQFIGLALLIGVAAFPSGRDYGRWYFVSVWLWSGLHKLLSADWRGPTAWALLHELGLDADRYYVPFAIGVAGVEIGLGMVACMCPRFAAIPGLLLHLFIVLFVGSLGLTTNASVIPWNLAMAAFAYWIFGGREHARHDGALPQSQQPSASSRRLHWGLAMIAIVMPALYYVDWVDRAFASVLYSNSVPQAIITDRSGSRLVDSMGSLAVPFPAQHRLYQQYLELTGQPGDKLHVSDPRPRCNDTYWLLQADRRALAVSPDRFFREAADEVQGVAVERPLAIFELKRAGARLLREAADSPIYAVVIPPRVERRDLLRYLPMLPHVREIQLSKTRVNDSDLSCLRDCRLLVGLAVNETNVSDEGIRPLLELPYFEYLECEGTQISEAMQSRVRAGATRNRVSRGHER